MVRIIHLSDFHLNQRNLRDWQGYVKTSLISKLLELNAEKPITFIAFTGDLIDEGGKDYKNPSDAFNIFKKEVIDPILNSLSLTNDRFLMIPGNHDVIRKNDDLRNEYGNIEYFKDKNNLNDFLSNAIANNDFSGMERIHDYKYFENEFYSTATAQLKSSILGTTIKFKDNQNLIGVSCLNSSWRCYSNKDKGNLLVGEIQLSNSIDFISDCSVKIALMHHPLDWLSEIEQSIITNHINKTFDILLVGHMHENLTSVHTGLNNATLFTNMAPSGLNDIRSDSRSFANGFSVIDFNKLTKQLFCEYLRYNHNQKKFVLNTDIANAGKFSIVIPDEISAQDINLIQKVLSNIREERFKEIDAYLIGQKAEKITTNIKEAFVLPPIDQGEAPNEEGEKEARIELNEITKSKFNYMFFGNQESGKSTLLFRLVREFVDEFDYLGKIPVYISLDEMGNKEVETCIKEYLICNSRDVSNLLENNLIVLLIDNLNFRNDNIDQTKKIDRFFKEYNKFEDTGKIRDLKVIATAENEIYGMFPTDYLTWCKIPFKNCFIKNLQSKEIKQLIKLWLPNEDGLQSEQRLDRLITGFHSYALPSTAMSVSLFLWSMENRDRKPINHAVLLEIYIEIVLEKLSKDNIYRDKFDFTNKVQLLAKIAEEMLILNQPNYSILYSEFEKVIETYLQSVGFDFDAHKIVEYFLNRKIFVKYQKNRIKFTYSCYFHFFIAKRMSHNPEFKSYVMEEENYYKFHREIDYYTALIRSDKDVFEEIFGRFQQRFSNTDFILQEVDARGIDKYFAPSFKDKPKEPIAKHVEVNKIKENRPSEEMLEDFQNKVLKAIPDPSTILKKEGEISLDVLITLMANVLRNSEGVEDRDLKRKAYNSLIKYSLVYMILYKQYLIEYVLKNQKLPPTILYEVNLEQLLTDIPYHVQLAMYEHVGSAKLAPIILDKIIDDENGKTITNSEIESFLSVSLYADIQGRDYPKYFKKFIKRSKSNLVRDYSFYKLIDYYYSRTKPDSPKEETYLDMLSELKIRSQNLPRRVRGKIIKTLQEGKKQFQKSIGE